MPDLSTLTDFSGALLLTGPHGPELEHAAGLADRAHGISNAPTTRFGLASLSKPFTAAAIVSAVADLDARVVDLLPPERRPRSMHADVTVRHLLTHTSGIGDYAEEDEDAPGYVEDYGSLWVARPSYAMETPDDFLPMYADAPPLFAPGEEWHYCNAGYVLLGAVLEEVTGEAFAEAVTRRVFEPAGMTSTGYPRLDEPEADVAIGYLGDGRTNVFSIPVVGGGDGGAVSTCADLDRFLRAIADGTLPELRTPLVPIDDDVSMGLGVFVRADGRFGHGGGDPGVETLARHDPATGRSLVVLCNAESGLDEAWDLVAGEVWG